MLKLENQTYIQDYCAIKSGRVFKNGKLIFKTDEIEVNALFKHIYKKLEVNYPKYFKMDSLSKLAFLGAEIILGERHFNADTALLFANKSSSLDTDVKYQQSIADKQNYFPSPAVFVYTLPNICLGEISIRHQLKSENSFFIFDAFNPAFMANYANLLIDSGKATNVLCGWVELFGQNYEAFLYTVSRKNSDWPNTQDNLTTLYNK